MLLLNLQHARRSGFHTAGGMPNVIMATFRGCACLHFVSSPAQTYEFVGEWLSLVEHLVRDQGVGGSNPLSPTNNSVLSFQELAGMPILHF